MQNIDPNELAKFEALAAKWWDPDSEFRPLHDMNPLRLNYVQSHVNIPGKKIIDIGCGGGIFTESLAKQGAQVTGIDAGKEAIAIAHAHATTQSLTIDYQHITAEEMATQHPQRFDVVTCLELLEHVPDPESLVHACATLLAPHGVAFFSTINRNLKSYLFAILGAETLLHLLPKGTHDYSKFIRPSELARWTRSADLTIKEFKGMTYNPLTHHFKFSESIDVNYLVYCVKEK